MKLLLNKGVPKKSVQKAVKEVSKWFKDYTLITFDPTIEEVDKKFTFRFLQKFNMGVDGLRDIYAIDGLPRLLLPHYNDEDLYFIYLKPEKEDRYIANYAWQDFAGINQQGIEIIHKEKWGVDNLVRVLIHETLHSELYRAIRAGHKLSHQLLDDYHLEGEIHNEDANVHRAARALKKYWESLNATIEDMIDFNDDLDILTRTLIGEYGNGTYDELFAVGCVIRNRTVNRSGFGSTYAKTCLQPWQFSCWNTGTADRTRLLNTKRTDLVYIKCLAVAQTVMAGDDDVTRNSDHYYADYIADPYWFDPSKETVKVGVHRFFNLQGKWVDDTTPLADFLAVNGKVLKGLLLDLVAMGRLDLIDLLLSAIINKYGKL